MINATLNFFINFLTISFEVLLVDLTNTRPIGNELMVLSLRPHGSLLLSSHRQVNSDHIQLGMPLGYANSSISINAGVNL